MSTYPVSYRPQYVEKRSRLTAFFRLLMAIPLMIVGIVWAIAAFFTIIAAWFALVITGRYPEGLYRFNSGIIRYAARVGGYLYLQADAYPPFDTGEHPEYPIQIVIAPPQEKYSRLTVFFRVLLAIPVYIVSVVFTYGMYAIGFVTWLVAVVAGKTPRGLFNATVFLFGFMIRVQSYMAALLTDQYPSFSDDGAEPGYLPPGYGQQYGQPQYGQPQYGQPQYGQPQYGQPQYGQPQYAPPQYAPPQYAQPQYAPPENPYAAPGQGTPPAPAQQPPPDSLPKPDGGQ